MFKGPYGFGRVVNIGMNIIMCLMLSFYVLWTVQHLPGNEGLPIFTPLSFAVEFVKSFAVGMIVGDYVPANAWGMKLADALHIKNKILHHCVSTVVIALVMVTSISFICTWIANVQTSGMDGVIASWTMVYPFLLVCGYVVQVLTLIPIKKLAASISGFDPAAAPAPEA